MELHPGLCTQLGEDEGPGGADGRGADAGVGGNHLSNTTCLPRVFFKRGEYFSNLW